MPRVNKERLVSVPFGAPDELNVYINTTRYDEFNTIKAIKKLNQQSFLEIELEDVTDTDTNVKKGNIILIFTNNKLFQKYTITHVNNMSDGVTKVIGEGSGEYSLRTKTVTRDVEDDSKFTDSTSANVVTQTCSGVINVGTNTELGNITVRADYDNKLRLLSNTSKTLNGDWWFDQTETTAYTTDQFNVSDFRGSQTSVFTLNQSGNDQNMVESSREQDYDNLWNDVRILGFGDGTHQLTSRCFHATTKRTTLSADITATATTINFIDGSQFNSGDIIWIGMEKVTLTTVAGNQATSCIRSVTGDDAIDAYTHSSSISCYLYTRGATTYDTDTPEVGSSIEDNDPNQKVIQDKTIIDQNALDFAAQKILADHKDLVIRITCTVNDLYDFLDSADIGDTVTLNDTDAGLSSSEYRVVGFELISDDDWEELNIEISNGYTNLVEEIKGTQVDTDNLSRYMQGAPNVISIQSYENAQYSATPEDKAMKMKFRVWDKTITIQDARLDFKILPFRAYTDASQTATGGVAHNHALSGVTTDTNTNITEFTGGTIGILGTSIPTGTWTTIPSSTYTPNNDTFGVMVTFAFRETSSVGVGRMHFRVYDGSTYYPSGGAFCYYNLDGENSMSFFVPGNFNGITLTPSAILGAGSPTPGTFDTTVIYIPIRKHSHGFTGETTNNESAHTHTITMAHGIFEDTDNPTVKVQMGDDDDWNATKGYINSGSAYSYGTHNNIDISSELKTLMGDLTSTKRIRIQFEPQGSANTCRIEANADIFVHLSSD